MTQPAQDFPHPLPRKHGTGIPALAELATARARGWAAVGRALAPVDREWLDWVLTASVDDFELALGWRQGEEELFGKDLFALYSWCRARGRRQDVQDQLARLQEGVTRPIDAARAASLAQGFEASCVDEARAWDTRAIPAARAARSQQAEQLSECSPQIMEALEALSDSVAPMHYLRRLALVFVRLETGTNTVRHLQ